VIDRKITVHATISKLENLVSGVPGGRAYAVDGKFRASEG
jgi:hypothetical protein